MPRWQVLMLSDFQSRSRAFIRLCSSRCSFPRCEDQEKGPWVVAPWPSGWESEGEKVTYSYSTKENVLMRCQAKERQRLQAGELLRAYQQYSPQPAWGTMRWGRGAAGLVLLPLKRGVHSEGSHLTKLIPVPVVPRVGMHSQTIMVFLLGEFQERER